MSTTNQFSSLVVANVLGAGVNSPFTVNSGGTGVMTNIAQTACSVYSSSTLTNVTGDSTFYIFVPNQKSYDQDNSYTIGATGIFSAPFKGRYLVVVALQFTGIGALHSAGQIELLYNGAFSYYKEIFNPQLCNAAGVLTWQIVRIVSMQAADTIKVRVRISGSTKTISIASTKRQFSAVLLS